EFTPPWIGRPHVTMLTLNRLPRRQGAEIIAYVTGGKALPKEISDQIVDRTDGVPRKCRIDFQARAPRRGVHVQTCPCSGRGLWHLAQESPAERQFPDVVTAQPALLAQHCASKQV